MSAYEPWSTLVPGQLFGVTSRSGNIYDLTLVRAGPRENGLITRLSSGKLARFYYERLNWETLEAGLVGPVLVTGDEILLTPRGGTERRGRVVHVEPDLISYRTANGEHGVASPDRTVRGSIRLLFAATDWCRGDEFLVRSLTGKDYRGVTLAVSPERLEVRLAGSDPERGSVAIRVANIDLRSLRVLVPVRLATLASV
jgi:hypothetical protein